MIKRFKAGKLLSIRGGHFNFSLARWKKRRDRGALLRYFIQKPKKDDRTTVGKGVDYIGGLLLVWLAGFLLLLNLSGKPAFSLAISLLLLAGEALALKKVLAGRDKRRQMQQGLWSAGQRFMDDLGSHPRQEFTSLIKDLLNNLPGFGQLTIRSGRKKQAQWDALIDIKGIFRDVPLGVKCLRREGEQRVAAAEISAFFGALREAGLKNGLFITSGDFASGAIQVTREAARAGIKIMLVNRYGLIDLARQAGIGVFGPDAGKPAGAAKAGKQRRMDVFLDTAFGSRKKAKGYFWCGLLLYGGYLLLKDTAPFSLIYLFFAALNLLLGAGSLLFGKTLEQIDPLAGLEPEK